jgi:hypothetical protein
MRQIAFAAAALFVVVACSEPATPPADAPTPAGTPTAPPTEAVLEGDGFTPAQPDGGTALKLPFGMAEADVSRVLTGLHGRQPTRDGCADTDLVVLDWGSNVDFLFETGPLVGWYASEGAPEGFSTLSNIHVGSTLAEVRTADPAVEVREDTVGPEFSLGDVHGFLSGTGDDARVTALYAGRACIFR